MNGSHLIKHLCDLHAQIIISISSLPFNKRTFSDSTGLTEVGMFLST